MTCNISPGWGYSGPSVVKDQKCAVGCSSSFLCTIWKPQNWTAVHQSPFVCWIWRYKEACVEPLICSNKYFFHYSFIFFLKILVFLCFNPGFLVWRRVLLPLSAPGDCKDQQWNEPATAAAAAPTTLPPSATASPLDH